MIVVQTLSEFLSFIDMAKQQNISYSIIGSEKEGFEGVLVPDKRNNKFYGKYALLCPSFKVFVSVRSPLDEKHTITDISSSFGFTEFKHISLKDGILYCNNRILGG